MYPLPASFDGSILLEKTIEQVCFAQYQVILDLSGETNLQICGAYTFEHDGQVETQKFDEGVGPSHLPILAGDTITEVRFDRPSGDLWLTFGKGATLAIVGDVGPYESYMIHWGNLMKVLV